jgi:hypothetical protein
MGRRRLLRGFCCINDSHPHLDSFYPEYEISVKHLQGYLVSVHGTLQWIRDCHIPKFCLTVHCAEWHWDRLFFSLSREISEDVKLCETKVFKGNNFQCMNQCWYSYKHGKGSYIYIRTRNILITCIACSSPSKAWCLLTSAQHCQLVWFS